MTPIELNEHDFRTIFECPDPENKIAFRIRTARPKLPISLCMEPEATIVSLNSTELVDILMDPTSSDLYLCPNIYKGEFGFQVVDNNTNCHLQFSTSSELLKQTQGKTEKQGRLKIEAYTRYGLRLTPSANPSDSIIDRGMELILEYRYTKTPPSYALLSLIEDNRIGNIIRAELTCGDGPLKLSNAEGEMLMTLNPNPLPQSVIMETLQRI